MKILLKLNFFLLLIIPIQFDLFEFDVYISSKFDSVSKYYWENKVGPGSKYYWGNKVGPGSKYYWENKVGPGSKYYWENKIGPGSKYYWENKIGPSVIMSYPFELPICIAISKSIGIF